MGNRIIAVVGVPGDPNIYYIGAASGGIFKTIDGGVNWEPIFDDEPVSSVGSLAIAPSDPNIIWAGTGETFTIDEDKIRTKRATTANGCCRPTWPTRPRSSP